MMERRMSSLYFKGIRGFGVFFGNKVTYFFPADCRDYLITCAGLKSDALCRDLPRTRDIADAISIFSSSENFNLSRSSKYIPRSIIFSNRRYSFRNISSGSSSALLENSTSRLCNLMYGFRGNFRRICPVVCVLLLIVKSPRLRWIPLWLAENHATANLFSAARQRSECDFSAMRCGHGVLSIPDNRCSASHI